MQMTLSGYGPDAFLIGEVRNLLKQHGKNFTLFKIDDVNNIGSIKLRIRSLVESLGFSSKYSQAENPEPSVSAAPFTKKNKRKKILAPFLTSFILPSISSIMKVAGYEMETLPLSGTTSCDWGLEYSSNEACYPATLIVGDIVKAFKNGRYDPINTCVTITQTDGQCRASSYISLIKEVLIENRYTNTPMVLLVLSSGIENEQSGSKVNWLKALPIILASVSYSDCITKFYYTATVREKEQGQAARPCGLYLDTVQPIIQKNKPKDLSSYLYLAARDFNKICEQRSCHKIGIAGGVFLKFNPFAQKDVTLWLINQKVEMIPPLISDFFMQGFVNLRVRQNQHLQQKPTPGFAIGWLHKKVQKQTNKVNEAGKSSNYFIPFESILERAEKAKQVISSGTQSGEGWLISGGILPFASQGTNHVIDLQPFGYVVNHIVEKGTGKRIESLCPQVNILSLGFDNDVSDVNTASRLLLFIDNINN